MSKLTAEQAEIVTSKSRKLVVAARAGSGKTYTLVEYARQNPRVRMLYLAYNRAIRDEAVSKFPVNVDCKTSHQLAFFSCGKPLAGKLSANLRLRDIATAAQSNNWTFARDVLDTLNAFMSSESDALCAEHFTRLDDNKNASSKVVRYQMEVVDWAAQLWERMIDPNDKFPATHDTYLKLFQLSQPRLSERYGAILFDEAQDSNPVTSAIVLNQSCTLVIVGDPHQQIYRFRGANDAMSHPLLADADRMYLTHSFRFGPQVAFVANALLELKGETRPVVGQGGADEVLSSMAYETSERHTAYINRTVMGVIADAIRSASHGLKTYWVGGIEGYNITDLLDVYHLSCGKTGEIRNQRIKSEYRDYGDYCAVAEATRDLEMLRTIKILDTYGDIPACIDKLHQFAVKDEMEARVTVTTAHRSKGLEWDDVLLCDDFPDFLSGDMDEDERNDEINLLYVACTRAMRRLYISSTMERVLNYVAALRRERQAPQIEEGAGRAN